MPGLLQATYQRGNRTDRKRDTRDEHGRPNAPRWTAQNPTSVPLLKARTRPDRALRISLPEQEAVGDPKLEQFAPGAAGGYEPAERSSKEV